MPASSAARVRDEIRAEAFGADRFVDVACRLRVYERGPDDVPVPGELLPRIYGGRYDRVVGDYVGGPAEENIQEVSCHRGQLPILLHDEPNIRHVLLLGGPGGGKSDAAVRRIVLNGLDLPGGVSGVVAPVREDLLTLWDKLLEVVGPLGWIHGEPSRSRWEIQLVNGHRYQFRAAKRQSEKGGSRIAGKGWQRAVADEVQFMDRKSIREIDARGRIHKDFCVYSTATNDAEAEFQEMLADWRRETTRHRVFEMPGPANVFTPSNHWQALRELWGPEEYNRRVLCLDVPDTGRLFPQFSALDSVRALPDEQDLTEKITREILGKAYKFVVGTDFGSMTTASIVLRRFTSGWWAVDEITTEDKGTDYHGAALLDYFEQDPSQFVCLGDPQEYKEVDKSDYRTFKQLGINVTRASGEQIAYKHRVSMMNALLRAHDGKRRFFVVPGRCERLRRGLAGLMKGPDGRAIRPSHRGRRALGTDFTHQCDAAMFGLFRFERIRGLASHGSRVNQGA